MHLGGFERLTVPQLIFNFWALIKIKEWVKNFFMSIDSKTLEKIFLEMMGKKSQKGFCSAHHSWEYKKLLQTLILPPYAKKHIK